MNEESESFINDVKYGKIKHPTQIGFSEKKWKNAYKKYENVSESDENLFFAGLWFDRYFRSIRSELIKYDDKIVDLGKLRQMYVATINRDFCVADAAIKEHLEQESNKEKQIIMGGIAEKKLPIGPDGYNVHVSGAIEASLNALRFPLSETFQKVELANKNLDDLEILNILVVRINLASIYSLISNMWHECLWNKWVIDNSSEKYDLIRPSKFKEHLCRIISEHRFESLSAEFSYHTINLWNKLPDKIKEIEKNKLRVIAIEKKGKRKVIKLGANSDEGVIIQELSMAVAAEEQYWDKILIEPLPNYPDLTLRDMIEAWRILSSLGRVLKAKAPNDNSVTRIAKLIQFAPKLRINELINTIRKATSFTYKQAISIINICTFRGNAKDDLWLKPFIPIDDGSICILIPSLIITNRIRLIEAWMREGGIDLGTRGKAFEEYVRTEINKYLKKSVHLSGTFVYPKALKLKVDDIEEEIDFIWIIESLVLIGEIKCSLFPSSPIEFYNFFQLLEKASIQVKRKVNFVQKNIKSLYQALEIEIPKNLNEISVVPTVITNLPFGSGLPINDVPITDLRILIRYIEGRQKFFVSTSFRGDEDSTEIYLYNSIKEAQNNILPFLNTPPVIKLFKKCVKYEIEALWKLENHEKESGWLRIFVDESSLMKNA